MKTNLNEKYIFHIQNGDEKKEHVCMYLIVAIAMLYNVCVSQRLW